MRCRICQKEFESSQKLSYHLKIHKITTKEYYNKYLKTEGQGICKHPNCSKQTTFTTLDNGYLEYCSSKCALSDPKKRKQIKKNLIKKYGVSNPMQLKEVKEKVKQTNLERYGVENPSQNKKVKEKIKQTNLKRYGTETPLQSKKIKDKIKESNLKKYGVEHHFQINKVKEKIKKTNLNRYGVENPSQNKKVKEKIKQTNLEKYSVENVFESDEIKEKIKQTNLKRYGGAPTKNLLVKVKIKNTIFKRYGVKGVLSDPDIKLKAENTLQANYGVKTPMHSNQIKNKVEKTCLERYGNRCVLHSDLFKDKIKEKIKNKFLINFKPLLDTLHLKLLDGQYIDSKHNHNWLCTICNSKFSTCWNNIQRGYLCPNCFKRNPGSSIIEDEIFNFLTEYADIDIERHNRTILRPKEIDIYIPFKNIAIEFNGLYWHSEEMGCDRNYHLNKTLECEKQGIQLIHIFEDEWIFKQDIVKARLKQILGVNNSKRIHARKCKIKEIKPKTKNEFLEKYHIQGKDSSVIKLGAFHDNELVSVMTFSHGNISKGSRVVEGVWELNRFCSDYNYHIPGIASKLLTFFQRNYDWASIFSYADRRWSVGNVYKKLAFDLDHITQPNYWYVKNFQRIHRFNLRKKLDEPKDISEWILRSKEGYNRIWDCGSFLFEKQNKI